MLKMEYKLRDGFKLGYTTIPFAFYKLPLTKSESELIPHQHKELELIAMVEGEADFYLDTVLYRMKKGDVLVIPPYCIHRAYISAGTAYECACFDLSLLWDVALAQALENGKLTVNRHLNEDVSYTEEMNACIREAISACAIKKPGWEMCTIGNLSILFSKLKGSSFFIKASDAAPEHIFGKLVLEYVKEHYFEPITSRTVAEVLYLNNSYFCRLFKKTFGCCFTEYLINYRVERAKYMLSKSEKSISEIALKTGFSSFSYFSKTFRTIVGVTPSVYRKKIIDNLSV